MFHAFSFLYMITVTKYRNGFLNTILIPVLFPGLPSTRPSSWDGWRSSRLNPKQKNLTAQWKKDTFSFKCIQFCSETVNSMVVFCLWVLSVRAYTEVKHYALGLGRNKPVAKSERCRLFLFHISFSSSYILKKCAGFKRYGHTPFFVKCAWNSFDDYNHLHFLVS